MKDKLTDWANRAKDIGVSGTGNDGLLKLFGTSLLVVLVLLVILGMYWSSEPDPFDIDAAAADRAPETSSRLTTGSYTTSTVITAMETLLNKRGGYLSNDIMPPSIWLDNIPNWEFGVLVQVRDMSRSLRNDFSRSQSQSAEDVDLIIAEPKFNFDHRSWFLPASESVYREGIHALYGYLERLQNPGNPDAQFYARADNLKEWLGQVEKRLGSLSQRLSASVGQVRLNTDLAGDAEAVQSTQTSSQVKVKTPWISKESLTTTPLLFDTSRASNVAPSPLIVCCAEPDSFTTPVTDTGSVAPKAKSPFTFSVLPEGTVN